jgi:hypothetical protein
MEAPGGQGVWRTLDRAGDFSPHLPTWTACLERQGFVTLSEPAQTPTQGVSPKTDAATKPSRSTTPESRIGRRTCALPVPSGEQQYAGGEKG